MSLIESVLSYFIGDNCLLISVWPSTALVHSSDIYGVLYCTMVLMCSLPNSYPATVVLFCLVADGTAVEVFTF